MTHDPNRIKPYANYHRREKPMVIIKPQAYPAKPKPKPRNWKVAQYVPIVREGLVNNGTRAIALLNLSWLPEDASPQVCLAWARAFCQALEGGLRAPAAAQVADRALNLTPDGQQVNTD